MTTLKSLCDGHIKILMKLSEIESARRLEQSKRFHEMIKNGAKMTWDIHHPNGLGWLKNAKGLQ